MIKFILKLFKPTIYIIEKLPFLGDSIVSVSDYTIQDDLLVTQLGKFPLYRIYLFHFQAKKELTVGYDNDNIKLAKMLKEKGYIKSNYEYIQVIEDGEASTPYQNYLSNG